MQKMVRCTELVSVSLQTLMLAVVLRSSNWSSTIWCWKPTVLHYPPLLEKEMSRVRYGGAVILPSSPCGRPHAELRCSAATQIVTSLAEVARVKGLSKAEVAAATTKNAVALFKLE